MPVAAYSLVGELDGGAKTVVKGNQTLTRNSFVIPEVSLGEHICKVTVRTAAGKEVSTTVKFTQHDSWTGEALSADGSALREDGELVYELTAAKGAADGEKIDWPYVMTAGSPAPAGVGRDAYSELLTHCWWANAGEKTVTLRQLVQARGFAELSLILPMRREMQSGS